MYKNIVFDLGDVVLGRDFNRFDEIVGDHFSFFRQDKFPDYWHDFDRGTRTKQEVAAAKAKTKSIVEDHKSRVAQAKSEIARVKAEAQSVVKEAPKNNRR
jgi:FMN phosphatase YigB (HAD superfamily)